jgi:PII-like signaling protein
MNPNLGPGPGPGAACLLRLYLSADDRDRDGGRPLYESVVLEARALGLAGASVFRAELGFGARHVVHDAMSEYTFAEAPIVVEAVDSPKNIRALLAAFEETAGAGLATVADVRLGATDRAIDLREEREDDVATEEDGRRATVYVGSSDTWHGANLAEAIVERCRKLGLAGATATRGVMGFGKNSRVHRAHFLGLSEDLPTKVEIVDRPETIAGVLPALAEMVSGGGLVVVEDVRVIRFAPPGEVPR